MNLGPRWPRRCLVGCFSTGTTREILAVRKVLQCFAPNRTGLCQMASDGLRSVGDLQVASGWLVQTPLGLFVLASGWLTRSQWVAYVNSIGRLF